MKKEIHSFLKTALIGIGVTNSVQAALVMESTYGGFGSSFATASDLTAYDFSTLGIVGSATANTSNFTDYIKLDVLPNTTYSIPYTMILSDPISNQFGFFEIYGLDSGGGYINQMVQSYYTMNNGVQISGTANFTTGATTELAMLLLGYSEGGTGQINYTVGAVPEPSNAMLSVLGLSALAMRRKRP